MRSDMFYKMLIRLMPDSSLLRRELSEIKKQAGEVPVSINTGKSVTEITDLSKRMTEIAEKSKMASGAYDPAKLKANLAKAGLSVQKFNTEMEKTGQASKRLSSIDDMFHKLPGNIKRSESALDKFGKAMVNSMRYNLVNGVVDAIGNVKSTIDDFFRSVDKNLTQIRIVTGKSENTMDSMYRTGIKGAKEYGRYTREYLETAQIYYQQGLSQAEVMERTNATLMASNISGQDVATTSEQITAVLNGYNIEASRTVEILDMMAKIGAETATDFAEISASMQKVASAASETGMSVESTLGMLSTISSVTREAPETIGTSLNAIIGRLGALKAEEIGDASSFTSQVEKAMQNTGSGLSTFDVNGQLKDTTTILTDVAEKWEELDVNQQRALTTAMAGTRQANRLMALLGNWEMYEDYTSKAENASGAMEEQNKIYLESYEAAQKRLAATVEDLVSNLIDRDFLKNITEGMTKIVELTSELSKGLGGIGGILGKLAPLWGPAVGKSLAPVFSSKITDITGRKERMAAFATQTEGINRAAVGDGEDISKGPIKLSPKELSRMGETEKNAYLEAAKAIAKKNVELRTLQKLEEASSYNIQENIKDLEARAKQLKEENEQIDDYNEKVKERIKLEKQLASQGDNPKPKTAEALAAMGNKFKKEKPLKSTSELNESYKQRIKQIMQESGMESEASSILEEMKGNADIKISKNAKNLFNINMDEGKFKAFVKAYEARMGSVRKAVNESNGVLKAEVTEQEALMARMLKEQKVQNVFNNVFTGISVATSALSTWNSVVKEGGSDQEKAQSLIAGLGSAMSLIPGWGMAAGMAVSTLGPIFIEVFDIGISRVEKFTKKVDENVKSIDNQLKTIRQQKTDLSVISGMYKNLTEEYAKNAFAYNSLTEEMRSQYDQVAQYVEKYAPELVKYYDAQGKAVIDLARGVEYLNNQYKSAEQNTYEGLDINYERNAEDFKNLSASLQERKAELTGEISKRQDALFNTNNAKKIETINKEIETFTTQLDDINLKLQNVGKQWSESVSEPMLRSIYGFNDLAEETQNAARAIVDYRTVMTSGFDSTTYLERVKLTLIDLNTLTKEQQENFSKMSDTVQSGILRMHTTINGFSESLKQGLLTTTEESYRKGTFLDEFYKVDPMEFIQQRQKEYEQVSTAMEAQAKQIEQTAEENTKGIVEKVNETMSKLFIGGTFDAGQLPGLVAEDLVNNDSADSLNMQGQADAVAKTAEAYQNAADSFSGDGYEGTLKKAVALTEAELDEMERIWMDSLDEMTSTVEGHNKLYHDWVKVNEDISKMQNDSNVDDRYLDNIIEQNEKRLAILMKDNTEYYKEFKTLNQVTMESVERTYGVNADEYHTYAEYKLAIDEAVLKKKELLEDLTYGTEETRQQALLNLKMDAAMNELKLLGDTEGQRLMMIATAGEREKLANALVERGKIAEELNTVSKLKEILSAREKSEQTSANNRVNIAEAEAEKILKVAQDLENKLAELEGRTAKTISTSIEVGDVDAYIQELTDRESILERQLDNWDTYIGELKEGIANNPANKEILELIEQATKLPEFEYSSKLPPGLKPPSTPPGGPNGGAGGSGADKEKPFEEEIDYLREYLIILDELERELQKVNDLKETSVGPAYLKALKEEQRITKEMLENEKFKQQLAEDEAARLKGEISKINSGISFNDFGMIENYNEILKQAEAKINLLSGAEREAAIEQWETLKELMTDYEEVIGDGYDALEAQREKAMELSAQKLEAIEYEIDMIVKVSERDKETLDAFLEFAKLQAGKNAISIDFSGAMTNLVNAAKMVSDLFNSDAMNNDAINNILNDPDLTDADKETALEAVRDQYLSNMEELVSTLQDMDEMFADGLENVAKVLEEHLEQFDAILSQYEYMMDLMDRTGADPSGKNGLLDQMVGIYNTQIGAWQQAAEGFKDARDSFEVGTDEWLTANAQYMAAMDKVMSAEKQLLDALESKFDNSVSSGRTSLEEALFGGMSADEAKKALQEQQEAREKYLDTQERIYETSKLERDIQKEIDKYTNNPKAQAQLKKFMDSELSYLKNKEKLTESDLELSQKQYNIVKARIAMEEAREQKQFVQTLQRNANGTFGFVFSAGPNEEFEKAKQDYENAINDLYEFAMKEKARLENESISIKEQFLSDYDDILKKLKAGKITQEEADQALIDSRDKMLEKLKENAEQQAIMNQQIAGTEIMQILAKAGADPEAFAGLESQSEALKSIFDTLEEAKAISGDEMASVLESLGLNINDYSGSLGEIINSAIEDLGGDEEALKELTDAFAASGNETVKDLLDLVAGNSNLSGMIDDIFDQTLNGAGSNLGDFMDDALAGFDEVSGQFDENNPDSLFNTIKDGILGIFAEYNATLEDAMDRMEEHLGNVGEVAGVITDATQGVVDGLVSEIDKLVELQKEYASLREEIIKTIEVLQQQIANANAALESLGTTTNPFPGIDEEPNFTGRMVNGDVVLGNNSDILASASVDLASMTTPTSFLGDIISAVAEGVYASKDAVKDYFTSKFMKGNSSPAVTEGAIQQAPTQVTINADFPNATNKDEIVSAFETLRLNAEQYVNKK